MDKRQLCALFRDRLAQLLAAETKGVAGFLRDTGMDRSALSQFLDPSIDRLPRAETLRRIGEARGVSVDWLLGLENAPEGRQQVAPSFQIEQADDPRRSPLHAWHREAEGQKLRYVPSTLPDTLQLSDTPEADAPTPRQPREENVLDGVIRNDLDIEIAMPVQTLQDLATQSGLWRGACPAECARQLEHMAETCDARFPALRLHLYDGQANYSSPFTVFGRQRVALYIGEAYLVLTGREQIAAFTARFDALVRAALVSPDRTGALLRRLADTGEWAG
ncbi:transcriptional regulator [Roseovarius faecimaris]|uniref:Transcriptional regulator n=1 Tax=Roseovarius faecimaris TaxID=2494550 RepID=A0A6I6IS19_9RHOB|nr:Scr1 family TA system antitoxin-like transcriptional regulator [Roseovarius faecimaris]QGX99990.1 transcriptional regulator [Roseovarius faecimaris]